MSHKLNSIICLKNNEHKKRAQETDTSQSLSCATQLLLLVFLFLSTMSKSSSALSQGEQMQGEVQDFGGNVMAMFENGEVAQEVVARIEDKNFLLLGKEVVDPKSKLDANCIYHATQMDFSTHDKVVHSIASFKWAVATGYKVDMKTKDTHNAVIKLQHAVLDEHGQPKKDESGQPVTEPNLEVVCYIFKNFPTNIEE